MGVIEIIELIGVVAFALSGVLVGIEYELDVFGIALVGVTSAVGGGVIRDLILGNTPAVAFTNPVYVITAIITVAVAMIFIKILDKHIEEKSVIKLKTMIAIFDAIGLGLFAVNGTALAFEFGYQDNFFLCVFTGLITAIGGGIYRDILSGRKPSVLRKEIYAVAVLIGCVGFYFAYPQLGNTATYIFAPVITLIRLIAIREKINLSFRIDNKNLKEDD